MGAMRPELPLFVESSPVANWCLKCPEPLNPLLRFRQCCIPLNSSLFSVLLMRLLLFLSALLVPAGCILTEVICSLIANTPRGHVALKPVDINSNAGVERVRLDRPIRSAGQPESLSGWVAVDAFPEATQFSGAMSMRCHPLEKNKWYIATFHGKVFEVTRLGNGSLVVSKIIDISGAHFGWLYSMALHPQFAEGNPVIYLFYRSNDQVQPMFLRVVQCRISDGNLCTTANQEILIEQNIDHFEHLGGGLDFDDEGFLLVAIGDNGRYNDLSKNSQKIHYRLFSGILRIDVDCRGGDVSFPVGKQPMQAKTGGYFIPASNPFVGVPGALQEFWSIGFRSPFSMHYDRETASAWVGEVGQDRVEQLERAQAGTNHLWSFREGNEEFTGSYLEGNRPEPFYGHETLPFYEYLHRDQDYCIITGPVYRSDRYPDLKGRILFGDNQSGRVWAIRCEDPTDKILLTRLPTGKRNASLTSICVDIEGRIFLTSFASPKETASVHELVPVEPVTMPSRLSETDYFTSLTPLQPRTDFVAYSVNSPLWSDGLNKLRWFRLPPDTTIDNEGDDYKHWEFPMGTVFIKHFESPDAQNPAPVETRILIQGKNGSIYGATYRWNSTGDDAEMVPDRESADLDFPNSLKIAQYRFPSPADCLVCHNPDNQLLGFTTAQLNRDDADGQNQLVRFTTAGLLRSGFTDTDVLTHEQLYDLRSYDAPLEDRARSYLHSNCSFCHHEHGTQRTYFSASRQVPLTEAKMLNAKASTFYMQIDGRRTDLIVSPGRPEDSLLYRRFVTQDMEYAMPHLGRNTVDHDAAQLLQQWIHSLK